MGLDMFMNRTKKIDDMTLEEILMTAEYVNFLNRPEKYKSSTFETWYNGDMSKVREDKIDKVIANIHTCYSSWDTEKEYGYTDVSDGVAYWRKANAIHNWIIENCADGVDECQIIELTKENLESLLDAAKTVKKNSKLVNGTVNNGYTFENGKEVPYIQEGKVIEDPSVAIELLPTTSGFFFGSTDYDEWYLEDIKSTIEQITKILKTTDFDTEYVSYHASW